jgi:hypothetical protein
MTPRSPIEFTDEKGQRVGNQVNTSTPKDPADFVYEYLIRASGPQSPLGTDYDMDTASNAVATVFEYQVPGGKRFKFNRINFVLVDDSISPGDFGGIGGGLTNGCLLQIVDSDGSTVLCHFGTDTVVIKTNADFAPLAGTDVPISALAGDDLLPVRFSVFKAGSPMLLTSGQRMRWTNRDDLSAITKFRAMVQGVFI